MAQRRKKGPGRPVGWRKKDARRARLPPARCTDEELRVAEALAERYAGGELSRWIVYAVLNAPRKKIGPETEAPRG